MRFLRQWLLILFALVLSSEIIFAASSAKEARAYSEAVAAFQDGIYPRAETGFEQFVNKFPESTNVPMAMLLRAQAQFKQGKFTDVIALLSEKKNDSGNLADQYVYWTGEAQFANGNLSEAADTFTSLARTYAGSRFRLSAVVEAAAVYVQVGEWQRAERLLEETNGVFAAMSRMDSGNELISRGRLLLAQAKFEQKNFTGAATTLASMNSQTLKLDLDWQRAYLLCHVKMAMNDLDAALSATTNLTQIARLQKRDDLRAESMAMRGGILEKMNLPEEASAAYRENLADNVPVERQRQAILKIADLAAGQKQFSDAEQSLENYLARFPNSSQADITLLTLGELDLKNFAAQPSATNLLQKAYARFAQFIGAFTNSPLIGNAFMDRGWCYWLGGKIPESLKDFRSAEKKLPPSPELAAAKFKIGDALFKQNDFAGARENYRAVIGLTNFPVVAQTLADGALYQEMRASLELKDRAGAGSALAQLLKHYPPSELLHNAELLYGEGLADLGNPIAARITFETFEKQFPDSLLRAQVELAIARTYELQQDWTNAVAKYQSWLGEFPANELRPQIVYSLALANSRAGDETNALNLFTPFIVQFPANDFAPLAQWWIADHFFRANEFIGAETNYERVYQEWPASDLAYPARIMAGRVAVARLGYKDAMRYYADMINDTNCPPDLAAEARFALGSTLMRAESGDANNPLANFLAATNVFAQIVQLFPGNEFAALALGEIGNCDLQLGDYAAATNAYAQVINFPSATLSARSEAKVGIGIALEKIAAQSPDERTNLLNLARSNYLDVFYSSSGFYRDGELPDEFWMKKAGLQALPLLDVPGAFERDKFIDRMETLLPQMKMALEKMKLEKS